MAIAVLEALAGRAADFRILATDISATALGRARAGVYDESQLARMRAGARQRWFDPVDDGNGDRARFRVKPALRELIVFKRLNLVSPPFPMPGPLDVIFCRNVMIYFDGHVRTRLLGEIERLLGPGCLLMTGHSEALAGRRGQLEMMVPSVYRKLGDGPAG